MICKNCNMPQEDGLKFCTNCGAPLEVQEPVTENTENIENTQFQPQNEQFTSAPANGGALDMVKDFFADSKKRMIAIGAAVLVLAVIIIVCLLPKGSSVSGPTTSLLTLSDGSETFVFADGKKLSTKLDGRLYNSETNLDGNIKLVTTKEASSDEVAYHYYMVTTKEAKKITKDTIKEISMNAEGGKAAYTNDENVLYLYDGKNSKKIDANVGDFVISPNGKSILYSKSEKYDPEYEYSIDEETPDVDLYMYDGKKSTQLDKNKDSKPMAISDDCKFMYIGRVDDNGDTNIYAVNKKGETDKLGTNVVGGMFNRDHSQIILIDSEDKSYISVKGKERIRISGFPSDILTEYTSHDMTLSLKDFKGMVYNTDGSVYIVNKKYESEKLKGNVVNPSISADGKTLFYTKSRSSILSVYYALYSEKMGTDKNTILCEDIDSSSSFTVTYDGKYVYYIEDNTLFVIESTGKGKKKICDDVDGIKGILSNGTVFFAVDQASDGAYTLYSVTGKKDKVKIADDVYSFGVTGNKAYYKIDKTSLENGDTSYTYYFSNDGKKFTKIMSDVVYGY